jgi:hypothetical protein
MSSLFKLKVSTPQLRKAPKEALDWIKESGRRERREGKRVHRRTSRGWLQEAAEEERQGGLLDRSTARYFYKGYKTSLQKHTVNLVENLF